MSELTPSAASEFEAAKPPRGGKRRFVKRWTRRSFTLVVAVVATVLTLFFTVDLGRFPLLKQRAESEASKYLRRPMHIGRIGATIAPGVFTFDDVVIDGKHPGDRPFLKAGRIYVYIPWWTLLHETDRRDRADRLADARRNVS